MPPMFERISSIRQILALAMSLCLIWAVGACVFICAAHVEEDCQTEEVAVLDSIAPAHEADCCPLLPTTRARPESRFEIAISIAPRIQPFSIERIEVFSQTSDGTVTPTCSPPFERLRILRI